MQSGYYLRPPARMLHNSIARTSYWLCIRRLWVCCSWGCILACKARLNCIIRRLRVCSSWGAFWIARLGSTAPSDGLGFAAAGVAQAFFLPFPRPLPLLLFSGGSCGSIPPVGPWRRAFLTSSQRLSYFLKQCTYAFRHVQQWHMLFD